MNFLRDQGVKRKFLKSITNFKGPLFITGDISDGPRLEKHLCELSDATEYPIYFVTGNHDYYHSSFSNTRKIIEGIIKERENLVYLPVFGIVPLSSDTCVIGTDSWCDCRISPDPLSASFTLNDFNYISDLCGFSSKSDMIKACQTRADAALEHLRAMCEVAAKTYKKVIILSHQVPFGRLLTRQMDDISPFYVWYDAGKFIMDFSDRHNEVEFLWLCGHTHSAAEFSICNFSSHVLGAEYFYPRIGAVVNDDLSVKRICAAWKK